MYFRLRTVYERLGVGRRAAYVSEASFNGESIFFSAGRLFLNIRSIKVGCDKKHLHTAHSFFIVKIGSLKCSTLNFYVLSGTPAGAHEARMKLKGAQVHAGGGRTHARPQHRRELTLICCGCAFVQATVTGQQVNSYRLLAGVAQGREGPGHMRQS